MLRARHIAAKIEVAGSRRLRELPCRAEGRAPPNGSLPEASPEEEQHGPRQLGGLALGGLVVLTVAVGLLIAPLILIVVETRSSLGRWYWIRPAWGLIGGVVAIAASALAGRMGVQMWSGKIRPGWTTAGVLLALVVGQLLGALLVLRSVAYLAAATPV